jgi:hypothetical protein
VSWTTSLLKPAEFTKAELKTHLRDLPAEEAEAKAKIRLALSNGTYKGGSPVTITAAKELKQADRLTIRQAAAAANAERRARRTAEVLELEQRQAFLPQGAFAAAASGVPSPQPGPGQKRKRVPASTPEPDEAEQDETMEPSDASASQAVEADSTDEPGPPRKKSKTKMYVSPANAQVWATRLEAVKRFLAENGHSVVPQHWKTADGFKLGMWVSDQRKAYRSKRMPAERILELKKLKGWLWVAPSNTVFGADDDLWNEHFKEYEAFVEVNGEARVPRNHETATGLRLGGWVCTQRERYQEKKLSPERIARLSAISSWRWVAPVQVVPRDHAKWNSQYEDLEAFVAENPDVPVPHGFITEGGFKLGQWVKNQRATHSQGKMPSERVERLEAIPGWRW